MTSLLDQTKKLNSLLDKSLSTAIDGDRVAYTLTGFTTFRAGDLTASEAVLNIPKDADFYGTSLNMYLQGRLVSTVDQRYDDRTWRPVPLTWMPTSLVLVTDWLKARGYDGCADFKFELRDSLRGPYQSAPLYSSSCFSHYRGFASDSGNNAWTGAMLFKVPYYVPRGETITIRVTPIDSGVDDPDIAGFNYKNYRREYRVVSIINGYKSVHAFK